MFATAVCDIDQETVQRLKRFRFAKLKDNPHFYMVKVNKKTRKVELEVLFEDGEFEDVVESLPEDSPRYIVVSTKYVLRDGRTVYPLVVVYYRPETTSPDENLLYASAQRILQEKADLDKVYSLEAGEDFSKEWLEQQFAKSYK